MTTANDTSTAEEPAIERESTAGGKLPEFVDWIIAAVIAIGGLLALVGASALLFVVDREQLADGIADGTITVTVFTAELTEAEMLEVADAVTTWTGAGLLLTGLGMVLFAVGYVLVRHRRRRAGGAASSYGTHALLGAVAAAVLSFLPFSPAIGGALAGYLEWEESDRTASVGAVSGLLAMAPALAILVFALGGTVAGLSTIGQGGLAALTAATAVFAAILVATIGAGLGAVGGYAGGRFAENRASEV